MELAEILHKCKEPEQAERVIIMQTSLKGLRSKFLEEKHCGDDFKAIQMRIYKTQN